MSLDRRFLGALAAGVWCWWFSATAQAQGLLWTLPAEDGAWVRYEGTFQQTEIRPDDPEGNLVINWIRHLYLKSVGRETVAIDGRDVPCRWIEIKSITGKESERGIDPGPVGARIYKVLVPEPAIAGAVEDQDRIPVAFIPIVKGYQRVGEGAVEELKTGVLQVYPTLSMLMHYRTLKLESEDPLDPQIPLGPVSARLYTGVFRMESATNRSSNEAELYRSDEVPFGLAKWTVRMSREAKDAREPRSQFQRVSEVRVEMSAHEVVTNAESELATP